MDFLDFWIFGLAVVFIVVFGFLDFFEFLDRASWAELRWGDQKIEKPKKSKNPKNPKNPKKSKQPKIVA